MAIRTKLKQSLDVILRGSQHDVQKFVEQYRGEFNQLSVEQIAFPRGISDVQKYRNDNTIYNKSTPIHVRGALLYNHYLREKNLIQNYKMIHEGDKLRFVYLKTPNPIHEDVIAFIDDIPEEFGLIEFVDYDKMFEKTFLDAIQGILDAVKWSAQIHTTLEEFFA
jgi:DNA polymerase elongation subunit (family B)